MPEEQVNTVNPPEPENKDTPDKTKELESRMAQKEAELVDSANRIAELEKALGEKDGTLAALQQSLKDTVEGYKGLLLRTNPEISPELITGDNLAAIDSSLEKARGIIGKVRQSIEKEQALARVPVGSPARRAPDVGALSPREKIQYGISRNESNGGKK